VLLVVTVVAYWPSIGGGFIWDDDDYVLNNVELRTVDGLQRLWIPTVTRQYYPVVFTSFWIEYQIWGDTPLGYHLVNVVLHLANVMLVWRIFTALGVRGAWLIAAVFALHPVHVESVAWITERKNVLSTLFYLLATLTYLRFDRGDPDRWRWYTATAILFLLALLSKTVTCTLPAALVLALLYRYRKIMVSRLLPLVPLLVLGLALALHTVYLERSNVGAVGPDFQFTFLDRCLIAARALLFYPWKILWPDPIIFFYPRWSIGGLSALAYWPIALVIAIAAASVLAFVRGWRGPALALAFYAGTIFPALGFFNIYPMRFSFVADHFQYLASLGLIAFFVGGAAYLLRGQRWSTLLAPVVLVPLLVLTWRAGAKYENVETLWQATIADNDSAWMPHSELAAIHLARAEQWSQMGEVTAATTALAQAHERVERAIQLKNDAYKAHAIRAEIRRLNGDLNGAIDSIRRAIALADGVGSNHWRHGRLLELRGDHPGAEIAYLAAIEREPAQPRYRRAIIRLLNATNRTEAAEPHLIAITQLDPYDGRAHLQLAAQRIAQARHLEAAIHMRDAVQNNSDPTISVQLLLRAAEFFATCPDPAIRDEPLALQLSNEAMLVARQQSSLEAVEQVEQFRSRVLGR
jgi:tetratricopeptide (TPR) repeat protein